MTDVPLGGASPEDPVPDEKVVGDARQPSWEPIGRRIVVMRHGVTGHNLANIVQGQLDIELSPTGREQVEHAARFVARTDPQVIISSDLTRASETAAEVAGVLGLPVELDERLRESHSGAWQGVPVDDLDPRPEWSTFGVDQKRGGTGESVLDVAARVRPLLEEVCERLPEQGVALLVTHGVTARALVAELIGMDQDVAWRSMAGLHNGAWAVLEENRIGWRLRSWNVTAPDQADLGLSADSG